MHQPMYLACSLLVLACGDNKAIPDGGVDAAPAATRAIVVSGDFMPGSPGVMSSLDLATLTVTQRVTPNGSIGDDPVVRAHDGELLVVNRADGNNVTIVDGRTFAVIEQLATGAGSNPQDVAAVGTKLFVPAMGTAGVVVVTRGQTATTTIDLSSLDPDGKPDCVSAFAVGNDVYVACGLLDQNFSPRGPGKVVVIDATSQQVKQTITLANKNPFGLFERMPADHSGDLAIPTVPDFTDFSTGCVERISTGASPAAHGCLAANKDLKGYAARVAFQKLSGLDVMWVVASSFDTAARGSLQGYDLVTDCLWAAPVTPPTQLIVDVTQCSDGTVVVADQTMAANGLRVYEGSAQRTTVPLPIGLKPGSSHGLLCD